MNNVNHFIRLLILKRFITFQNMARFTVIKTLMKVCKVGIKK